MRYGVTATPAIAINGQLVFTGVPREEALCTRLRAAPGDTDSRTDIAVVLRKCLILAERLGHDGLKKWVEDELNGYPPGVDVPPYRVISPIRSLGHFMGMGGEQIAICPCQSPTCRSLIGKGCEKCACGKGSEQLQLWSKAITRI